MEKKDFDIGQLIEFAWDATKANFLDLLLYFLLPGFVVVVVYMVVAFVFMGLKLDQNLTQAILSIIQMALVSVLMVGIINICLRIVDSQSVSVGDFFATTKYAFNYFLGYLVYSLIVFAGFLLFIVPGCIWLIQFQFYPWFVTEGYGPIEALKKSSELTRGVKWKILGTNVLCTLIGLLGLLCLLIGLIPAAMVQSLAQTKLYRELQKQVTA